MERGGCREGWELSKGGSQLPGNKKGQIKVSSSSTDYLFGGWWWWGVHGGTILGRVNLVIVDTAEGLPNCLKKKIPVPGLTAHPQRRGTYLVISQPLPGYLQLLPNPPFSSRWR